MNSTTLQVEEQNTARQDNQNNITEIVWKPKDKVRVIRVIVYSLIAMAVGLMIAVPYVLFNMISVFMCKNQMDMVFLFQSLLICGFFVASCILAIAKAYRALPSDFTEKTSHWNSVIVLAGITLILLDLLPTPILFFGTTELSKPCELAIATVHRYVFVFGGCIAIVCIFSLLIVLSIMGIAYCLIKKRFGIQ
jgi:hypothetical protein